MGERINIQEYIDMIKRRKWIIIVILLLSLALGGFKTYQNYVSYVPMYTSSVVVKIDTMKVQKEEAQKEREKGNNKSSKKNKNNDNSDDEQSSNDGTYQTSDQYTFYNYSAIAQDESIATRYYTYAADSAVYDKVAQVAGVRSKDIESISASQNEERKEEITISVTSGNREAAHLVAAAMPKVYGDLLLKEVGIDCVATVYDATKGTLIPRRTDTSIPKCVVVGLVIAIFIVLLLEILNTKIVTPDDVEKYWELPLLGVVPEFEDGPHQKKQKKK